MDYQLVINITLGLVAFLGGWVFNMVWSRVNTIDDDLWEHHQHHENDLKEVRKQMADLALSLPEKYVAKEDLDKLTDFINERFNKLEQKIDNIKKD